MHELHIIRHLHDRAAGISSYDRPVPEGLTYLAPDVTFPGRLVRSPETSSGGGGDDPGDEDVVWYGAEKATASRKPVLRTKASTRVRTVDREVDREIVTESVLEYGFWQMQRAGDRRRKIWDQPPARHYVHPDGTKRSHTFDFLVEEPAGSRLAYAVRRSTDVDEELLTAVGCIREQALEGFADDAIIVTERHVTKARVRNSMEILDAREHRNEADVRIAADLASRIRCGVRLHDLVQALDLGPRGRTAVLCLVDDGVLDFVAGERLGSTTLLRPSASKFTKQRRNAIERHRQDR